MTRDRQKHGSQESILDCWLLILRCMRVAPACKCQCCLTGVQADTGGGYRSGRAQICPALQQCCSICGAAAIVQYALRASASTAPYVQSICSINGALLDNCLLVKQ